MEKILNKAIQYGIYVLTFLVPLFFFPASYLPVLASKQAFTAILVGLILILWIIKIIITGEIKLRWSRFSTIVFSFLSLIGVSTIFSVSRSQSFFGFASEPDTFFSFILYTAVFFIFSSLTKDKFEVLKIIKIFITSCGLLAVLFLLTLFAKVSLPLSLIGTAQALGILFGGGLILSVVLIGECLKNKKKCSKPTLVMQIIIGVLLLGSIIVINFIMIWVLLGLTCLAILWLRGFNKQAIIPICLLVISLLFVVLKVPINKIPTETTLSYTTSFNIARNTVSQGLDEFLIGTGPSTFGYNYELFKPKIINTTDFWQTRFNQGIAVFLTVLTATGVLGLICFFFLIFYFLYSGLKLAFKKQKKSVKKDFFEFKLIIFIGALYFLAIWFFYSINFTLMFLAFLMLGLWELLSVNKETKLQFKKMKPQRSFVATISFVILIILVVVGIYGVSRDYIASVYFNNGVESLKGQDDSLDEAIKNISKAVELSENDIYYRELSRVYMLKLANSGDIDLFREEKTEFLQDIVDNVEGSAIKAFEINPKNSVNWVNAADIYFVLSTDIGVVPAESFAILLYDKTKQLSPYNPAILYKSALANVLIAENMRERFSTQEQQNTELFNEANKQFKQMILVAIDDLQKTLLLRPNFIEAQQLSEHISTAYQAQ